MNPRFYLPEMPPTGGTLSLRGPEFHHLRNVLRLGAGERIFLFDGKGRGVSATILRVTRAEARVQIEGEQSQPTESPLALTLIVALPKGEKIELIIQKATELGVAVIEPVRSARVEVRKVTERAEKRLERWRRVALEACKQSGRTRIPLLEPPRGFEEVLSRHRSGPRLLLDPRGGTWDPSLGDHMRKSGRAVTAVGPEGGWAEEEREAFQQTGFIPLRLGPRTLRTETAAILSTALLQFLVGDLTSPPVPRG